MPSAQERTARKADLSVGGPALRQMLALVWRYRALYLMLLPAISWYAVYEYLPLYGLSIAFKDYRILQGILKSPWSAPWYKHLQTLFNSPYFGTVLKNTIWISFLKLSYGIISSLVIALLLDECRVRWYSRAVQTLNFAPFFLSWVVVYGVFSNLFSEQSGVVSQLIKSMGASFPSLLQSTKLFRSVLVATSVWKMAGYDAVILLAALSGVDPHLYEAARVDGANRLKMIYHISLPSIRGTIILLLILRIGTLLQAGFDQVFIFYNPRVYGVADIIDTWVYRMGLEQLNFSLAVAVGLFQSVIGFILVLSANRLAKWWGENIW
ncbi:MAG: ABC transporter permease [Anaerolineae bacterium]|jgi:putative aldouronate transport system permease protein